jgi:hypothetical protein
VDPGGIGPPPRQCECRVMPLYYGPAGFIGRGLAKAADQGIKKPVGAVGKVQGDQQNDEREVDDERFIEVAFHETLFLLLAGRLLAVGCGHID